MTCKWVVWVAVVGLLSCGQEPVQAPGEDAGAQVVVHEQQLQTVRERLAESPLDLVVVPFDSQGTIQGKRTLVDSGYSTIDLSVLGGRFLVGLQGQQDTLRIERGMLRIADVTLDADQVPPNGLMLTDLIRRDLFDPFGDTERITTYFSKRLGGVSIFKRPTHL